MPALVVLLILSLAITFACGVYMFSQDAPLKWVIPGACVGLVASIVLIIAIVAKLCFPTY